LYNEKCKFIQHLIANRHTVGPTDYIIDLLYTMKSGHMNMLEKIHIHLEAAVHG